MTRLLVRRSGPLRGRLRVPSDLAIGQQAIVWGALGSGQSVITGLYPRPDHELLVNALRSMGVSIADTPQGLRIAGVGVAGLRAPPGALDAGASPSTLEILAALLVGQRFGTRVEAAEILSRHPLTTLIEPLRARGAPISAKADERGVLHAPVSVAPLFEDEALFDVEIAIPEGDPATKLALFVSGLRMRGITAVSEGVLSADHVERALVALGLKLNTMGTLAVLDTSDAEPRWDGFAWQIPGDFSLVAPLLALVSAIAGSDVQLEGVGVNRTRASFLDVLRHAGAHVSVVPKGDSAGNEPVADLRVQSAALRGVRVLGELAVRTRDELGAIGLLGAAANGRISVRDLGALRTLEPCPLTILARVLRDFGAECTDYDDGFDLDPMKQLVGREIPADAPVSARLLGLFLGLVADGETVIGGAEGLDALYPGVVDALTSLGAPIELEKAP